MYSDFLTSLKKLDNFTYTENGAGAYRSTGNALLDAFGSLGAMKFSDDDEIIVTFYRAYAEDPALAMKLLFYIRDIRGGQGMRRIFRVILRNLALNKPEVVRKNLDNIMFYGRGDDLMTLIDTPVEKDMINYIKDTLESDYKAVKSGGTCSLLAKWLPSLNTSSADTRKLAHIVQEKLGLTERQYRKRLAFLRKAIGIVESKMSQDKWDTIEFDKLPSRAAMKYPVAFINHLETEYLDYLKQLSEGNAKVNAGALFPVDIVGKILDSCYSSSSANKNVLYDAMWKALPNYFGDTEETGLCVVDTSGSMYGEPMNVAISLGIYCADKARGPFKDHFITFSSSPKLQKVSGKTIADKVACLSRADWGMNTDIARVFHLILNTAKKNHLPQSDLPTKLYIVSDMQFDEASTCSKDQTKTLMESMSDLYKENGYDLPALVYWNVRASNCGMFQMDKDATNCCFVSGYSPSLFKSVIEGTDFVEEVQADGTKVVKQKIDPMEVMLRTLNNERYDRVVV